jgi:hypothetical protein
MATLHNISELSQQLGDVLTLIQKYEAPKDSKLFGQINLELLESGTLSSSVWLDEKCVWTPWSQTEYPEPENDGTDKTRINFANYPNFATDIPLQWLLVLLECQVYWEMATLTKHRGFFLRILRKESHYNWANREWSTEGDIGFLIWGNGQGSFKRRTLFSSDSMSLPSFES